MRKILLAALVSIVSTVPYLNAQSTGTVVGSVRDTGKALIPGVQITLTNAETKKSYNAITNVYGEYKVELPSGSYLLTAELRGFKTAKIVEVNVKNGESTKLDPISLEIAIGRDMIPIPLAPVSTPSNRI